MKNFDNHCPDANLLAEFIEGKLMKQEHEKIYTHIAGCRECRDLCRFAVLANRKIATNTQPKLSLRRLTKIRQSVKQEQFSLNAVKACWDSFKAALRQIFIQQESAEVIAAGESAATVTFRSAIGTPADYDWKMALAIPTAPGGDLAIKIRSAKNPSLSGKLIFCGNELTVKNGKASIAWETLKESFSNPEVAFIFANNTRITGFPEL